MFLISQFEVELELDEFVSISNDNLPPFAVIISISNSFYGEFFELNRSNICHNAHHAIALAIFLGILAGLWSTDFCYFLLIF